LAPEEIVTPFAPVIVKELEKVTKSQDKAMAKFEVKVIGHPKPKVKWLKHGEEITPSDEFQIEKLDDGTSILIINDVYPDDTGEIKFEAYNVVGVAETTTQFVVEGKKGFPQMIKKNLNYFFLMIIRKHSFRNIEKICSKSFFSFYPNICFINIC
jgi:Immunoglobulin I-set domain